MNPMMHHTPAEASGDSRASGSSSYELQKLDRASKLLVGFISQLNKEGYESSRLKASIGTALFKYVMRYAPENSHYFNRDRLVVSGHYAGRWQDLFVHLIGAKGIAVDPLGVASVFSRTTTLPCHSNQAISSAIGQAIAMRNLTMLYNKPGLELLDNMIWCVIDDAKFQQDSALKIVALAGSWKLSNLCVIYDSMYDSMSDKLEVNNFKTRGWNVIELVNDDDLTITALCMALSTSRGSNGPTLISVQSPNSSLSHRLHSHPNNNTPLYLPLELYDVFQDVLKQINLYEADWLVRVKRYRELYPALAREFWNHVAGKPATINQHQTALTGPITPPLSPWPAEQRSRRGEHSSLGGDNFSQQPDRRSRPGRTKPETLHIRPCDAEEAAGAFLVSIRSTKLPTTISLPQNGAASFPGHSSRLGVTLGAYAFSKCHDEDFDLTLMTAGVGIHYAMGTQEFLEREYGLKARIVSCPCLWLFQLQTEEYRRSILQVQSRNPTVAIDFGNSQGWKPYADALVLLKESVNAEIEANMPNRIGPRVKDFVKEFQKRNAL
ncbi:thiamine diphosphate-binding protein [Fusarium redolens]|uniref:Thiamine diphosphate-binding protein n=1 Tax=Fusarium redolens TaxID=48865 RepID=A0A9P9JK10_FUSRE|nr:thiamine diphosphate-binding protein [Fusarium redolens]KAH7205160.1 thiamine diphosphate-binding protein [Fusarium redolens]